MSTKKIHDGHFKERRPHTIIKHRLFHSTLKRSLGIASVWSEGYVYLDLFAGDGYYEDGSEGSPLIALKEFSKYLEGNSRRLQRVYCAFCEKFGTEKLKNSIIKLKISPAIEYTVCEDWEEAFPFLKNLKERYNFGFIFADQYATELNLRRFIDLVGQGRHDFLIFYNPMALKRLMGKVESKNTKLDETTLIKHICKVLDVERQEVKEIRKEEFKDFILSSLKKKLGKLRDLVIIAALPNTRKEKLTWSDYFYLVLGTNHPKVADAFVEAYEKAAEDFRKHYGIYAKPLFLKELEEKFKNSVLKTIQVLHSKNFTVNLYLLYLVMTYRLLSWKQAVKFNFIVPTMKNLVRALNELEKEGKIKIRAPLGCKYAQKRKRGQLKHSFQKLQHLKSITILPLEEL